MPFDLVIKCHVGKKSAWNCEPNKGEEAPRYLIGHRVSCYRRPFLGQMFEYFRKRLYQPLAVVRIEAAGRICIASLNHLIDERLYPPHDVQQGGIVGDTAKYTRSTVSFRDSTVASAVWH
ncbi:hypothetical protein P3T20_004193 [Paraburkholderia sp. GAS206C]|jgi:hypothetical protein|uniref:Uncharacterized protein n=1 Tax=Paraburkholderia phenazinium TaxID=60549 RepID=A0A1N6EK08_9BURK|nr:hypothetical protein SAMN05444168_0735 [Paraburkholderia phenazinium]